MGWFVIYHGIVIFNFDNLNPLLLVKSPDIRIVGNYQKYYFMCHYSFDNFKY